MKELKQVVEIKYLDSDSSDKNYSYFCDFEVKVGDKVYVPTYRGIVLAEITQTGLTVDDVDRNIVDRLKVIKSKDQIFFNMTEEELSKNITTKD